MNHNTQRLPCTITLGDFISYLYKGYYVSFQTIAIFKNEIYISAVFLISYHHSCEVLSSNLTQCFITKLNTNVYGNM